MKPVQYMGDTTNRVIPSGNIWANCPAESLDCGRIAGVHEFEHFDTLSVSATAGAGKFFGVYEGSGSDIALIDTEMTGVVRLSTGGTDNDEIYMGSDGSGGFLKFTAADNKPAWFEARIRTNIITASSIIVGLINAAELASDLMADTQTDAGMLAVSEPDFIGFVVAGDTDPDGLDAVYNTQGTTATGHVVHANIAQLVVAATWYNVGITWDGVATIKYWIDNAQVGTDLAISTTTVPDGEELAFVAGCKSAGSADKHLELDWVRWAQRW